MAEKCVDTELQLEIDIMVLDYLVFTAIKFILEDYERRRQDLDKPKSKSDMLLRLVDSFLPIFRAIHPNQDGNSDLKFRLQLLKFTVLFMKRSTPRELKPSMPVMHNLRKKRQDRASHFRSSRDGFASLDLPDLTEHLAPPHELEIEDEQMTDLPNSPLPTIPLLDVLPHFMTLSAAQNAMQETTITDIWMHLAAGFMAQAVIEQYLVYASKSHELLQEAFAWGFDADCAAEEGSEEWQVNAMFWGEDGAVTGWDRIRDEYSHLLIPPLGTDLQQHLRTFIAGDLSITKFEDCMLNFLEGLHRSQPRPLLAQVESGKVNGLSRRQLRALQENISMA